MIFAAGLGTRLKPLTDTMPKAMVTVDGKPLLWHAIHKLKTAGFDEIIINVHHFAEQIIDYVQANQKFGIRIEFSDERELLLDTGGGIKKAAWFFDDDKPFLIHNVDILSNIDLKKLYFAHSKADTIATLVCSVRQTSRYLLFNQNNYLTGWMNEKTGETRSPFKNFDPLDYRKLAFSGIHILNPLVFKHMNNFPDRFSIIDFYISICGKEKIGAFIPDQLKLIDVGKIDSLNEAEKFIH